MSVWEAMIGQQHAAEVFKRALEDQRGMTHAWLITGPPGSGRSIAARAFAAALECENGTGCGTCKACHTVLTGTHPDVTFVKTDMVVIKIDEVRELVQSASRSTSQGNWRIIVVEDADRMSERTTNVLLKSIEEPPAQTVWLLCAPSPEDVMVTIRSRCRSVGLRIPAPEAVAELLETRDGVPAALALSAARAAQSHVGIARRLATNSEARERRRELLVLPGRIRGVGDAVIEAAALVESATEEAKAVAAERDQQERDELMRGLGLQNGDSIPPALRAQLRQLEENQKKRGTRVQRDALDRAMTDLLSFYRDVITVQLGSDVALINGELVNDIGEVASSSTLEQTLRRMDAIQEARERLDSNVAPLLAVEAMLIALRPQG